MMISKPLSFAKFLTTPLLTTISRPARADITSALSFKIFATLTPTVPTPIIPIFIIFIPFICFFLNTLL